MAREIESNNKDNKKAAVDTQRDYDPHKSLRNVSKSKTITRQNTQPQNTQHGGSTFLFFQYFCKLMSTLL